MTAIYQIITRKDGETAYIASGKTLFHVPITITSLLFLSQFLVKDAKCEYEPAGEDNQLRLDGAPFIVSDNDGYLLKDILSRDKYSDHYTKYLNDLQALAASAAPFFNANAYEIEFPSALYAKYEDQIAELISILTEDSTIAARGIHLTKSVIGIGKNTLLPMLFNTGDKNKAKQWGNLESLIMGKVTLSPVISYYNISPLEATTETTA